jgi:hypothetical protein
MKGRCMCGAVTVDVTPEKQELHACHCDMCRRWTGSVFVEIDVADGDLAWDGPVKTFASSGWAERAWCDACGSTLWYKVTLPGHERYSVAAGLFDNAGGFKLAKEIYIDRKPEGFDFAGAHSTETKSEVEARFASFAAGDS